MRIAREGRPWVVVPGAAALVVAWLEPLAALPLLLAAAFCAWFFRDPERRPPAVPDVLISPADGRILEAGPGRVSVFMNVFDVHVCRAPCAGRVAAVRHAAGRFLAAWRAEAPECNERAAIDLEAGARRVRFTLVAGLVARRIVCRIRAGDDLRAGDRVGLIRFGSRVDVDLPPGCRAAVVRGQRVRAGETILARFEPSATGPPGDE